MQDFVEGKPVLFILGLYVQLATFSSIAMNFTIPVHSSTSYLNRAKAQEEKEEKAEKEKEELELIKRRW